MSLRSYSCKVIRQVRILSPFSEFMGAFIVLGGLMLCLFSKTSIHLFINSHHSSYADIFFTHATLLGDGISASLIVVILLFVTQSSKVANSLFVDHCYYHKSASCRRVIFFPAACYPTGNFYIFAST